MRRLFATTCLPPFLLSPPRRGRRTRPTDSRPTLRLRRHRRRRLVPFASMIATKTETPIERIHQAVSIVTEELLKQRRPQNLEQAISTSQASSPRPGARTAASSQFLIRGFDIGPYGIYRDGLPRR